MRIDPETIRLIQQTADIVEVVGDYVSLKKRGANLWACCPFHNEKSPSFSVAPAKGIYKCFGCGKAGDVIRFVMDVEGLSYPEALRHLAKKYGIDVPERELTPDEVLSQNVKESLYIVLNHAKNHFQKTLFEYSEGQSVGYPYFKERGFNDLTIKTFELGYSIDEWEGYTREALKGGFTKDILEKAGLTIFRDDKQYDRFRGRVIFPIHNVSGKVIAFGARILKTDKTANQPKYLNSPETEVYHKSNILYGIFQAKQAIRNADTCFLVEGYTDVISLHQAGIHNVVASSGTSLTLEQIRLIARFTQNITVLYDGDPAGIKAALRGTDMVLEEGLNVKVVVFPDGDDPDSYVKKVGGEAFKRYIEESAKDFITFKAELSLREAGNDPFRRAEIIKDMVESISKIPDSIKRTVFFQKTASLMGISEEVLIAESNKIYIQAQKQKQKDKEREQNRQRLDQKNQQPPSPTADGSMMSFSEEDGEFLGEFLPDIPPPQTSDPVKQAPEKPSRSPVSYQEEEFVRLMISYGTKPIDPVAAPGVSLMQYLLSEIDGITFDNAIYQQIVSICRDNFLNGLVLDSSFFIGHVDSNIQTESINLITLSEKHQTSENWSKMHQIWVPTETDKLHDMAYTNILRLKKAHNELRMATLKKQLAQTHEPEAQNVILNEFLEAKLLEKEIAKLLGTVIGK
jgi:DNA primase